MANISSCVLVCTQSGTAQNSTSATNLREAVLEYQGVPGTRGYPGRLYPPREAVPRELLRSGCPSIGLVAMIKSGTVEHMCVQHRKHHQHVGARNKNVLYLVQHTIPEEAIELVALRRTGWKVNVLRNTMGFFPYQAEQPWTTPTWLMSSVMVVAEPGFSVQSVVEAVMKFKPALVLPDQYTTVEVMQRAARMRGWPGCYEDANCRRAIDVLRCSLPNNDRLWDAMKTKHGMQQLARSVGVLVPFSLPLRESQPLMDQLKHAVKRHGSIVLKGRHDGGVTLCHRDTTSTKQMRCSKNLEHDHEAGALEQFIAGVTTTYVAACVDGTMLGGFSLIKQVTNCRTCPSALVRTFNDPTAAASMRRFVSMLGYTGIFAADFVTNASGSSFLIDFNPRLSNFATIDAEAAGLPRSRSLHGLLFDAIVYGRYPTSAQRRALLPHSALFSKYYMGHVRAEHQLWPPLMCHDLFLDVPWNDPWAQKYAMADQHRGDSQWHVPV